MLWLAQYVGRMLWGSGAAVAAHYLAPPKRRFLVPKQKRRFEVPRQERTFRVPKQKRRFEVK